MKKVYRPHSNSNSDASPLRDARLPEKITREEVVRLVQDLASVVDKNPAKAAVILTDWMNRPQARETARAKTPLKKVG
jgi:hypothetical protein